MEGLRIMAMSARSAGVWCGVICLLTGVVVALAADKKPNSKGKDEAEIQAAQKKLEAAKDKEAEARKSLQEANQRAQEAQKQVFSAREKVEQASDTAEVRGLRNRIAELTREQNRLTQPLLAALEEDPAHQALLAERDAARVELADQEEPVFKAAASVKLAEIAKRIAAREREALAQEPQVAAVRSELEAVGGKLAQLTAASRGALEKDSGYLAAKVRFGEAKERVESAELGLARARQAVSAAQRKVQQEVAEERAEDRREQQQKQKKKNDGKKK